jgi:hypothetical protein
LTADAMLMYGIDVRRMSKLADWCPGLQKVTLQKLRGADAERVKEIVSRHNRRIEETLDEQIRKGVHNNNNSIFISS